MIWLKAQDLSHAWQAEQARISEEAKRKRSEAAATRERTEAGTFKPVITQTVLALDQDPNIGQKAKSMASQTNRGAVARVFEKNHHDVLRAIENLECSEEFSQSNFGQTSCSDSQGRQQRMSEITQDGFAFLAMGFTGKRAAQFKEWYIAEFFAGQDSSFLPYNPAKGRQNPAARTHNDHKHSPPQYARPYSTKRQDASRQPAVRRTQDILTSGSTWNVQMEGTAGKATRRRLLRGEGGPHPYPRHVRRLKGRP